jgi:mRNA-degrading endonuclease toxin of MazEF toxin-antitoxin module
VIERGDIRWFRFESPDKQRPVLVLGQEGVIPSLTQVPVIPLSTQIRGLRWEIRLSTTDGLPGDCVLKPEWIKTVDRKALGPWITAFPHARWTEVTTALLTCLGFHSQ